MAGNILRQGGESDADAAAEAVVRQLAAAQEGIDRRTADAENDADLFGGEPVASFRYR